MDEPFQDQSKCDEKFDDPASSLKNDQNGKLCEVLKSMHHTPNNKLSALTDQQKQGLSFAINVALSYKAQITPAQPPPSAEFEVPSSQIHEQRIKRLANVLRSAYHKSNEQGKKEINSQLKKFMPFTSNGVKIKRCSNQPHDESKSMPSDKESLLCHRAKRRKSDSFTTKLLLANKGNKKVHLERRSMSFNGTTLPKIYEADQICPQEYLDQILTSRNYSTIKYTPEQGGYNIKPSPHRIASYGKIFTDAIRTSDAELLTKLLDCGLSSTACNSFGESIVHTVCRKHEAPLLKILLNRGATIRICDDFGRTPLHDACWMASGNDFACVEILLKADPSLVCALDKRGFTPLKYVPNRHWNEWRAFFDAVKDVYWPNKATNLPDTLSTLRSGTLNGCIQGKTNSNKECSVELASLIANGKLDPDKYLRGSKKLETQED